MEVPKIRETFAEVFFSAYVYYNKKFKKNKALFKGAFFIAGTNSLSVLQDG